MNFKIDKNYRMERGRKRIKKGEEKRKNKEKRIFHENIYFCRTTFPSFFDDHNSEI